jgi:hypothetical protein
MPTTARNLAPDMLGPAVAVVSHGLSHAFTISICADVRWALVVRSCGEDFSPAPRDGSAGERPQINARWSASFSQIGPEALSDPG